ncbi:GNAT family N-acetyltransferase [Amycolatopsis nigrescens]|uniref:GNAT family N-acetyltransferase n=1 Tax=Amycolatopsis nigrescens TaxID=381445 RepID=UPI000371595E|nr:GNAT family N-acetyltransferase [Amycolatopsis nigrescens]
MEIIGLNELDGRAMDAWHALRAANPALDSPYFHPGFARAVHESGNAVQVAVERDSAGEVCALLPLHCAGGLARPAGWPGADFQGPILAPGTPFDPRALLVAAGVRGFAFDHLLDCHEGFAPWVEDSRPSPHLDVTGGLAGYLGRVGRSGKDKMTEARRLTAKLEREHGPVRFEPGSRDPAVLDQVINLKRTQSRVTGGRDYFAGPGRIELAHRLLSTGTSAFGGLLSTVHSGDELVAAHFGLRAGGVLHWWFPVYAREFARFSPGWVLLRAVIEAAPVHGLDRIDLGRGEDDYKRRAMTGQSIVRQGMVSSGWRSTLRKVSLSAVTTAKASPLAPQLRALSRKFR